MIYIIKDILAAFRYIPVGLLCALLIVTIHIASQKLRKKRLHWKRLLHEFLLICYIVLVLFIALFSREPGSLDALALVPFSTWGITAQAHAYVIENVLLFIPFGFLLPFVWEKMRSLPFCLFVTFLASLSIEITQVITQMRFVRQMM